MGMRKDMNQRETHPRVDDRNRQQRVKLSRQFIYDLGYGVTSTAVEEQLQSLSLVPTEVRQSLFPTISNCLP
jgi:hypothetical protein